MNLSDWPDQLPPRARRRYIDIAESIATGIATGKWAPGDRLPSDRELAQRLGVSRPTVREALLALEYTGMIDVRQGSGAYVTNRHAGSISPDAADSPEQVMDARISLEPAIARLCATRIGPERVKILSGLLDSAEEEVGPNGNPTELVRLGLEFHREFAHSCENRFLASFCSSLVSISDHPVWVLLNRQAMLTVEARQGQVDEHRSVLEAVVRRDPDAAMEAMAVHLVRLSASIVGVA